MGYELKAFADFAQLGGGALLFVLQAVQPFFPCGDLALPFRKFGFQFLLFAVPMLLATHHLFQLLLVGLNRQLAAAKQFALLVFPVGRVVQHPRQLFHLADGLILFLQHQQVFDFGVFLLPLRFGNLLLQFLMLFLQA